MSLQQGPLCRVQPSLLVHTTYLFSGGTKVAIVARVYAFRSAAVDCPRSVARSASDIVVHALWFHAWLKISITAFAGAVFGPTMAPAMYAFVIALTAGSLQPLSVGYSTQVVGHVCPFGSGPVVVWGGGSSEAGVAR